MGRGKIEIKKIENQTNRQVTYSKRKNGLFKKAHELTVLCDAKVSIIMISNSSARRPHEYFSPSSSHKEIYDDYQQIRGEDLWNNRYEKMQNELKALMKQNESLKKRIRQRMGEDLGDLTHSELFGLEQNMDAAVKAIGELKMNKIKNETSKMQKKVNNLHKEYQQLQHLENMTMQEKCRTYGFMENNGEETYHKTAFKLANQASQIFPFHGQPYHQNIHDASCRVHDLQL